MDLALREGRVYLPAVVAAELASGKMPKRKRKALYELLEELPLCDQSLPHWFRVGELRERLVRNGISISTPDAHIAQCAIDLNGYLKSEDAIFSKIVQFAPLRLAD